MIGLEYSPSCPCACLWTAHIDTTEIIIDGHPLFPNLCVWPLALSGIAVSSVMLITTHFIVLFFVVDWELSSFIVVPFYLLFALIEGGKSDKYCQDACRCITVLPLNCFPPLSLLLS